MRNSLLYILTLLSAISFVACNNDFDLNADYKEIPVVYALLDASDTAQYFRVERAFIDESVSALELAQRPDSLYYDNAVVTLERVSTGDTWTFDRVDGNNEGYPRNEGVFAQAPNYLYKALTADLDLVPLEEYKLNVQLGEGKGEVNAKTTLVKPPFLATPQQGGNINLESQRRFSVNWNPNQSTPVFDAYLDFFYTESNSSDRKSVRWTLAKATESKEVDELNEEFYGVLVGQIPVDENVSRTQDGAAFTLVAGGQEIAEYIRITQANLGITSSDEIPLYDGSLDNGAGLFSSRYTITRDSLSLTPASIDSLRNGVITRDLNF